MGFVLLGIMLSVGTGVVPSSDFKVDQPAIRDFKLFLFWVFLECYERCGKVVILISSLEINVERFHDLI